MNIDKHCIICGINGIWKTPSGEDIKWHTREVGICAPLRKIFLCNDCRESLRKMSVEDMFLWLLSEIGEK